MWVGSVAIAESCASATDVSSRTSDSSASTSGGTVEVAATSSKAEEMAVSTTDAVAGACSGSRASDADKEGCWTSGDDVGGCSKLVALVLASCDAIEREDSSVGGSIGATIV